MLKTPIITTAKREAIEGILKKRETEAKKETPEQKEGRKKKVEEEDKERKTELTKAQEGLLKATKNGSLRDIMAAQAMISLLQVRSTEAFKKAAEAGAETAEEAKETAEEAKAIVKARAIATTRAPIGAAKTPSEETPPK